MLAFVLLSLCSYETLSVLAEHMLPLKHLTILLVPLCLVLGLLDVKSIWTDSPECTFLTQDEKGSVGMACAQSAH